MSGLKNTAKRLVNASLGRGYKTNKERRQEEELERQSALDRIYESARMPDPEELQRIERRRAAKRRGGRASTILTEDDDRQTLG